MEDVIMLMISSLEKRVDQLEEQMKKLIPAPPRLCARCKRNFPHLTEQVLLCDSCHAGVDNRW